MRGLGVRLKRGIKARGNCLVGHHEVEGRAARGGWRRRKKAVGVGQRGGEDTSDRWGPIDRETRERRLAREGVNQKGKHISREDATDAWAGWAGRGDFSLRGMARPVGWPGQRPNGPQGWPGRKEGKLISELKIGFSNLPRLWKFVEGDLGGILT
jgi:hypothetical protein